MIITSIASAILAAVTGMTTIRAPGGNEQQVAVDANYACEMSVATIANSETFFEKSRDIIVNGSNSGGGKKGKGFNNGFEDPHYTTRELMAVRDMMRQIDRTLAENDFTPVKVRTFRVYNVIEGALPNSNVDMPPEYTLYSFVDEYDNEISFLDSDDTQINNLEFNECVYQIDTSLNQGAKNHCTGLFLDHLIDIGLDDLWWGRYYGMWSLKDIIHGNDTTMNSDSGAAQAMLSGWLGWLNEHDPILFYRYFFGIYSIVDGPITDMQNTTINDLNVYGTCLWAPGDDRWITCPLAGFMAKYTLDYRDQLFGKETLDVNLTKNGIFEATNTTYNDILQLNDLIIY